MGGREGGIRVCDCQLWERDPLGGRTVQEKTKRKSKRLKVRMERRNGGECCFDVKGDGWAVVRRTREEEREKK